MDVRAFGSIYAQSASLPHTSGFRWVPSDGRTNFPSCRAILIDTPGNQSKGTLLVEFSDAPGQALSATLNLQGDTLYPLSCTALISGTVDGVFVLY